MAWADVEALREEPLNEREQAVMDFFVEEFIIDYNPYAATLRIGFSESFARDFAKKFMKHGYVRRKIIELEKTELDKKQQKAEQNRVIKGLQREAHYNGEGASHGARVAALKALATIYGMKSKTTVTKHGMYDSGNQGGVMLVPNLQDPETWSKLAEESQLKLKQKVKD